MDIDAWRRRAEDFIAIQVAVVIRFALAHVKNLLQTTVVVVLLLLATLNSYPFQPHRLSLAFAWGAVLFVCGVSMYIFVNINRNEVISSLSNQTPNKIDWDRHFVFALLGYVVIPLLVVASVQFPEIGQYVYAPLDAVSKAIK